MRLLKGSELLQGSDHEFILPLYRQILNRGPDERGYRHFLRFRPRLQRWFE